MNRRLLVLFFLLAAHESHAQDEPRGKDPAPMTRTSARKTAVVKAVERVKGAVVNIRCERDVAQPAGLAIPAAPHRALSGMGSGIVIDPRGYILTNLHVVDDVAALQVRLLDGRTRDAKVVARDPKVDLALIKIDPPMALPVMPIGTAADLMLGETVLAIGNAMGHEHTVSLGIVSAIKRDVPLMNQDFTYKSLIQTDAGINPGNSGGPLVNINGELIGVNVAFRAGAQRIGFAIPVDDMVCSVAQMLKSHRRDTYEGFSCNDVLVPSEDGLVRKVVVEHVEPSSPAAAAGLRKGDVLLAVGDVKTETGIDVERGLLERKPGDALTVKLKREDKQQGLQVVLAKPIIRESFYPPIEPSGAAASSGADGAATLRVILPNAKARIWFDGKETTQTGVERVFLTPALAKGHRHEYRIKAAWTHAGREVTWERVAVVAPNQTTVVDFTSIKDGPDKK